MFNIKSYILIPKKIITDLEEANNNPDKFFIELGNSNIIKYLNQLNLDYVDGAVVIKYYDQNIMDFKFWDSINWLWSYFLNVIDEYLQSGKSETDFPDCPTKIRIEAVSDELVLFQIVTNNVSKWTLPKKEFFNALLDGAKDFFENMSELFRSNVDYRYELNKINELKALVNKPT